MKNTISEILGTNDYNGLKELSQEEIKNLVVSIQSGIQGEGLTEEEIYNFSQEIFEELNSL